VITSESSNQFPWISIWRLAKPHANYCVDILKACWLRPAFAESYQLLRVNQAKKLVAVHVWNAPDKWHNWPGSGCKPPPGELNVKIGSPHLACILVFTILFILVGCCFTECFPLIAGFSIVVHIRIHCYYFSRVLASGLPSAKFPPLAQTSSYATALDQSLGCTADKSYV